MHIFQLHNISAVNNFAANKTENLDISEKTESSDKANISSISNISNVLDSSIISYLNAEMCSSMTNSEIETLLLIDQPTNCNINSESRDNNLNENNIDQTIDNENKVLPIPKINTEKLLMETTLDNKSIYQTTIEGNSSNINTQSKGKFKILFLYSTDIIF